MNTMLIALALAAIAIGIAGGIFITPVFIILRKLFYAPFINNKLIEEAIAKGNIVTAHLIDSYDEHKFDNNYMRWSGKTIGVYEYECNNRKYKRRMSSMFKLPEEITLYYLNNPRKAVSSKALFITQRSPWIRSFLVICFICWFLGFIYLTKMYI